MEKKPEGGPPSEGMVWQPEYVMKGKLVPGRWLAKRGSGRVWQMGNVWWIQYYSRGRKVQESAGRDATRKDAERLPEAAARPRSRRGTTRPCGA